jgi:hypothetical protein
VGYDFRPLLVPIFEQAVKKQFLKQLNAAATLKQFTESLTALNLQKLAQATIHKPAVSILGSTRKPFRH